MAFPFSLELPGFAHITNRIAKLKRCAPHALKVPQPLLVASGPRFSRGSRVTRCPHYLASTANGECPTPESPRAVDEFRLKAKPNNASATANNGRSIGIHMRRPANC